MLGCLRTITILTQYYLLTTYALLLRTGYCALIRMVRYYGIMGFKFVPIYGTALWGVNVCTVRWGCGINKVCVLYGYLVYFCTVWDPYLCGRRLFGGIM